MRGVRPGICVDVGGHIGQTAAKMAAHGHTVHTFEPFKGNLEHLRNATKSFGPSVKVYHGAVAEKSGAVRVTGTRIRDGTSATKTVALGK